MTDAQFQQLLQAIQNLETGSSGTDWIGAAAAVFTLLVALWALNYARSQVEEAKSAREQARELEVEKSQPYVVLFMEPSAAEQQFLDLVVRNYGQTAAHDIRFDVGPELKRSARAATGDGYEPVVLPEVLPILVPGQEWRIFWDSGLERPESDLPDRYTGEVRYVGLNNTELTTPVVLDWAIYKGRNWLEVYGIHHAAKALRDIRDQQKKWSESSRSGGLRVYSRDGDAKDQSEKQRLEKRVEQFRSRTTMKSPGVEGE